MNGEWKTTSDASASQAATTHKHGLLFRLVRGVLMVLLPVVVVAGGVIGAVKLIETAPKAEQRSPDRQAAPVQVEHLHTTTTHAMVQVMGSVVAAREVLLQPRVSGQIVELSPKFVPGGRFAEGEFILRIDPKDYELAVEKAGSQLAQADYESKLEQGHQEIAQREWELLDMQDEASPLDQELALRKPQRDNVNAALKAAQAALSEAKLNLERTTIIAPFNCMVAAESIDVGTQVTPQTQLGTLVGTDEYWVQAAVPVDQLQWIEFPDAAGKGGSEAVIRQELGTGVQGEWRGRVDRLMSGLERQGRMAQVLVAVPEPLRVDTAAGWRLPLLIDAFVNVSIEGRRVENVIALPRSALREDDCVWVMTEDNSLDIRQVDILYRNRDTVLVRSGLAESDRVVASDLSAPVAGMALMVRQPPQTDEPAVDVTSAEPAPAADRERGGVDAPR